MKESTKNILITILFIAICIIGTIAYLNRIEKINSGDFKLVYQYEGE